MRALAEAVLRRLEAIGKTPALIAIDGRCAAGKTTLAAHLREICACGVIPMDHFFLRPEQRTPERMSEPGGNVDYERFYSEVLMPLRRGQAVTYRPFDCKRQVLAEPVTAAPRAIHVIEGSYSCHPSLRGYYDLRVFLTVDEEEQLRRIVLRNGAEGAAVFRDRWIPLEERYFAFCRPDESCEMVMKTAYPACDAPKNQAGT